MIACTIFMSGKVQGVFFRDWTVQWAREFGVSGWVRNRRDGRVEVFAVGTETQVTHLIERLREGPPASRVDHVHVEDAPVERLDGFSLRRNA